MVQYKLREKGSRWKTFKFLGQPVTDINEAINIIRSSYKTRGITYVQLRLKERGGESTWDNF